MKRKEPLFLTTADRQLFKTLSNSTTDEMKVFIIPSEVMQPLVLAMGADVAVLKQTACSSASAAAMAFDYRAGK